MEGVTDIAVRLWFALTSPPDFVWTPFLRVTDTFPSKIPDEYVPELTMLKGAVPFTVIPQLMGPSVDDFLRTCDLLLPMAPYVDLNCGCPSPTVVGNRSGSSLLEKAEVFGKFVHTAVSGVGPNRMSIKMRTGYNDSQEFSGLLATIQTLPLTHLTVHGRTRPQRYTGVADWEKIHEASQIMTAPVVGSGDLVSAESAAKLLATAAKVEMAIIGRGALRNPWIFGSVSHVSLVEPLIAFALMQELGLYHKELLLRWAADGGAAVSANGDSDAWLKVIAGLQAVRARTHRASETEIDSRAFARVKMLWNYLRSSLPDVFMEPLVLRAKNLSQFIDHVREIARTSNIDIHSVPLSYRKELDWMYSGQGRSQSNSFGAL